MVLFGLQVIVDLVYHSGTRLQIYICTVWVGTYHKTIIVSSYYTDIVWSILLN